MIYTHPKLINICLYLLMLAPLTGQSAISVDLDQIVICEATASDLIPPDFTEDACMTTPFKGLDPQGRDIWIKTRLDVPPGKYLPDEPLAIVVMGKASSTIYLNGHLIGNNGKPGQTKLDEIPGLMDAAIIIPDGILNDGRNEVILRMSSQHGFLNLSHPIHAIALDRYDNPADDILRHYWPTLLPFGALVLAGLYLAVLTLMHRDWQGTLLLCLMSLFAAAQLFVEISRGTFAYSYPFHDTRLMLILICSAGFGISLLMHMVFRLLTGRLQSLTLIVGIMMTIALVSMQGGYDGKSSMAILAPSVISLILSGMAIIKKKPLAVQYTVALAVFCVIIVLAPSDFLDVYFYYVVASLLLFLAVQQAIIFSQQQKQHQSEKQRADQLQLIIDQNRQQSEAVNVQVKSAGKLDLIPVNKIAYCKGAGDYVELNLVEGGRVLHYDSLNDLEGTLPSTFLRIHRSYIVNSDLIQSLQRNSSGLGTLKLSNNDEVPVSRRIMPKIRKELAVMSCH